eukprot:2139698-Pleurochrysis_carterae.AAC.1
MASSSAASWAASVTRTSAARLLWALPRSVLATDLRRLGQSRCQYVPPQCRHLTYSFVQALEVAFGFASRAFLAGSPRAFRSRSFDDLALRSRGALGEGLAKHARPCGLSSSMFRHTSLF